MVLEGVINSYSVLSGFVLSDNQGVFKLSTILSTEFSQIF